MKKEIIASVFICLATALFFQLACHKSPSPVSSVEPSRINTSHLDTLYEEMMVEGDMTGIVHIYAEYPDYHFVGDEDEGITCVDDVSRAAIFYLRHYKNTGDTIHLHKGKMLLRFLLKMQAVNGYYYNFVWKDGTIHRDGITSYPGPEWWSWRVLWAFGEALNVLPSMDELRSEIEVQREKLVHALLQESAFYQNITDTSHYIVFATWLPKISGTDQASIVLIGLTNYLHQTPVTSSRKDSIQTLIHHFADGIRLMQVHSKDSLHDGAFLSWENLWHAYGNIQSYALLTVGQYLQDTGMINAALYEIDHFYPAFLKAGGFDSFWLRKKSDTIERYDIKIFNQIAYGRRPMIWASLKAFEITGDVKYLEIARQLAAWFDGDNIARQVMYDDKTGRGYDGIKSAKEINRNAGAESTIESLLSLQSLEMMTKKDLKK